MSEIPVSGGSLRVLDTNIGKSNIVDKTLYREILDNTCDKLLEDFASHCGPLSEYSVLDNKFSNPDKPTFSKDGIDILNSISYVNEVQDGIRRLLAYCASNSDKVVGDGTTSAIIISIKALQECLKSSVISRAPYFQLQKAFKIFQKTYNESKSNTFYVDNIVKELKDKYPGTSSTEYIEQKVIEHIAYSQAFVSSHGDHDLSVAVAKLFTHTPKDAWEHIVYRRSVFEKESERFKFEYSDDQFITTAKIMNKSMLNHKIGGKLKFTNATLIPMPHPILCSQRDQFKRLCDIIVDHVDNKKELLIIHTNNLDSQTTQLLNDLFENSRLEGHPNESVAIIRHEPVMENLNDITVLNLIAGQTPNFPTEPFNVIEGVSVEFDQFYVKINNLYDNPGNSLVHPFFGKPEYTYLTDVVDTIKDTMENYKNSGPTYSKKDDMKNFHDLYMKLKYTRRAVVTIGGLVHDSLSSVAVLEDALYATRSSLLNGFEYAAACGMWSKSKDCIVLREDLDESSVEDLVVEFSRIFMKTVGYLQSVIYKEDFIDICENDFSTPWDIYTGNKKDIIFMMKTLEKTVENNYTLFEGDSEEDIFIIQPKDINYTIIKRFGDLFLKLLNVNKFIVVGGVTLNEKKETTK